MPILCSVVVICNWIKWNLKNFWLVTILKVKRKFLQQDGYKAIKLCFLLHLITVESNYMLITVEEHTGMPNWWNELSAQYVSIVEIRYKCGWMKNVYVVFFYKGESFIIFI